MIKLDIISEVVTKTGITKTKAEAAVETAARRNSIVSCAHHNCRAAFRVVSEGRTAHYGARHGRDARPRPHRRQSRTKRDTPAN